MLCRFHKPKTLLKDQVTIDQLFRDVMVLAGKKGFECQRKGGSNGFTRYDRSFMTFLGTLGNFPRPAKNIVILQGKTQWECLYISANNNDDKEKVRKWNSENPSRRLRKTKVNKWNTKNPDCPINKAHPFFPVKWIYTPPVVGGSFSFPAELVPKYPFVFEFTELKLKTAYILDYLNCSGITQMIAPGAVHTEIDHLVTAMYNFQEGTIPSQCNEATAGMTKRQHILFGIMCCNKFTVVTHPVGMHEDFFGNNDESLENKITFICLLYAHTMGRGGNGHRFTWALLDWSSTATGRRRRVFIQLGGDDNLTLRADVWLNWLGEDNYRNLRRMVGLNPNYRGSELLPPDLRNLSQNIAPLPP